MFNTTSILISLWDFGAVINNLYLRESMTILQRSKLWLNYNIPGYNSILKDYPCRIHIIIMHLCWISLFYVVSHDYYELLCNNLIILQWKRCLQFIYEVFIELSVYVCGGGYGYMRICIYMGALMAMCIFHEKSQNVTS